MDDQISTPRESHPRESPTRVAIVDDHRLVLDGVIAHLNARHVDVDVVISSTSWLGFISHAEFPVDVVILDLNLNDGIPIATKIRALATAGSRTVIISRHADAASINGALSAGALAFVPKTESADELVSAVRAVSEGVRYLGQQVTSTLADVHHGRDPGLGAQEQRAMVLYASGRSIREVADEMKTTEETIKSYIKRARRKYRQIGVDVGTKVLLRRRGLQEGWLSTD
ncbi:MAG: response regulator transcription factor [Burkholderiaceae bacterium]|nr:response regulator transcription factor [Microbacteriaceae bacterium]